ncbi:MAG: thioesterase family protein [Thalassobaculaceae bacterium]|nr:thioesterase family protein [Thalassobaculaceae bacterium]
MSDTNFDPNIPGSFTFWTQERLRAGDLDIVGHVNNNAIGVFLENGRVRMFMAAGENLYSAAAAGGGAPETTWVVRRLEIDFVREIRFPGIVWTGTRVTRFGNTSCRVEQGVFVDGTCRVTAVATAVCFDPHARASVPISDTLREQLVRACGLDGDGPPAL